VKKSRKCWLWTGAKTSCGYGGLGVNGRYWPAHKVAFLITHPGTDLDELATAASRHPSKLFICHTCDNPACVRPSHLFLGTCKDNMQDSVNKGRHSCFKRRPIISKRRSRIAPLVVQKCLIGRMSLSEFSRRYKAQFKEVSAIAFGTLCADINPEIPRLQRRPKDDIDDLPLSRERKRQLRKIRAGICAAGGCHGPLATKNHCLQCAIYRNSKIPKKTDRKNRGLTYRIAMLAKAA
jgi:hypothetical protein